MVLFLNFIMSYRMASLSSSNETFCSLDMLAEVASATLQNDPSLMPYSPLQRTKNVKVHLKIILM